MIRCFTLTVTCIVLHVFQFSVQEHANSLPLARVQFAYSVCYLKWALALWALFDFNALLNRWAENKWVWRDGASDWDWKKEVAVVTGGSNGIGACVVKQLASYGIMVAVLDIEPLSQSFTEDERKLARYYQCDITSQEAIENSAQAIRSDLGSPSILINNAGIGNAYTILEIPPERLMKLFEINILSHWSTVKVFLPDMLARKKGHIMTVASLASFVSLAGAVDYSCTKSALLAFHEGLVQELKHHYRCPQIKTTIVHPNWTKSAITSHPSIQAGLKSIGVKLLEAENVADAMVKQIIAAKSGQLILGPSLSSRVRALPVWVQEILRDSQAYVVSGNGTTAAE